MWLETIDYRMFCGEVGGGGFQQPTDLPPENSTILFEINKVNLLHSV